MRKEKGMLVISIGPSEQDDENARLQQIAHDAGRVKKTPGRGPDLVLMDSMDDEDMTLEEKRERVRLLAQAANTVVY